MGGGSVTCLIRRRAVSPAVTEPDTGSVSAVYNRALSGDFRSTKKWLRADLRLQTGYIDPIRAGIEPVLEKFVHLTFAVVSVYNVRNVL